MTDPLQLHVTAEDMARTTVFRGADVSLILEKLRACTRAHLEAGEMLIKQGQENHALYIVLKGHLFIRLEHSDQSQISVAVMGDCVGEMSVIDGRRAAATVIAEVETELLVLPRELVWMLIDHFNEVSRNLLHILAGRLRLGDHLIAAGHNSAARSEKVASFDLTTQTRNRRWFDGELARLVQDADPHRAPLNLMLFKITDLEQINTDRGRRAGDIILWQVARAAARAVEKHGTPARISPVEFAVLLPNAPRAEAEAVAASVRRAVDDIPQLGHEGKPLPPPRITLGVAAHMNGMSPADLLQAAERALRAPRD